MTRALLDAVLAAPDDDGPRLVYADWLLERGDPRGEFIQLQCGPVRNAKREAALLKEHQQAWLAPLRPHLRTVRWRRGFVEEAVADGARFLDGAQVVLASTPLRALTLTALRSPLVARLARMPELERLGALTIAQNRIGPEERGLFESPHLGKLGRLDLSGNPLGREGILALARASLPALRHLDLSRCGLDAAGCAALREVPFLGQLKSLALKQNPGLGASVVALVRRASSIERLDLSATGIDDAALAGLVAAPGLPTLTWLGLFGNGLGEKAAMVLVASPNLPRLTGVAGIVDERRGVGELLAKRGW